ncbi:MAG: hypothetical protein BWZ05_02059 [Bacteroidetes bacterium ADurb.BinA245]|jgi:hypothetical protein|nr:MAG: hypothetical protein BWZ05_02059 [Bacteroidetes bacterium ADurb.BinA245]
MKKFWRTYGLYIEIAVMTVVIVLMIYYKFWEEAPEKKWHRWVQIFLFSMYLTERIFKLKKRKKRSEVIAP